MRAAVAALFCLVGKLSNLIASVFLYVLPKRGGNFWCWFGSISCRPWLLRRAKLGPGHRCKGLRRGISGGFRSFLAALCFDFFARGDRNSLCVSLGVIRLPLSDNV